MTIDRFTNASHFCGSNAEVITITNFQYNQINNIRKILMNKEILSPDNISELAFLSLEKEVVHEQLGDHDVSSESHCYRTAQNAYETFFQIDSKFTETLSPDDIKIGGLLHDIGKLCVDKEVLTKAGALTKEEVEKIKMHPNFSNEMLCNIPGISQTVLNIACYHHEKWDGSGYPCGIKGESIPLEARIFSVIDVWDALISERPYRKEIPHTDALKMMMGPQFAGHFDPKVLSAFVESKKYLLKQD